MTQAGPGRRTVAPPTLRLYARLPSGGVRRTIIVVTATIALGATDARAAPLSVHAAWFLGQLAEPEAKHVELSVSGFATWTDPYVNYAGIFFGAAYHLSDRFGLELVATVPELTWERYSSRVREILYPTDLSRGYLKIVDSVVGIGLRMTPIEGAMDIGGLKWPYQAMVAIGLGAAATKETCLPRYERGCSYVGSVANGLKRPDEWTEAYRPAGLIGVGVWLGLVGPVGLRLDVRDVLFRDRPSPIGGGRPTDYERVTKK